MVPISSGFNFASTMRNMLFVFLGVGLFMSKRWYSGPMDEFVHSYLGNFSVSFAAYFLFANLESPQQFNGVLAAASALSVVELFETFDGFGIMSNTYDPIDFFVNALGIGMAFLIDSKLSGKRAGTMETQATLPRQA